MTGKTSAQQIVSLKLTLSDWLKLISTVVVFVTGPVLLGVRSFDSLRAGVLTNRKDIERHERIQNEQSVILTDAIRLIERINGRLERSE